MNKKINSWKINNNNSNNKKKIKNLISSKIKNNKKEIMISKIRNKMNIIHKNFKMKVMNKEIIFMMLLMIKLKINI